MAGEAPLHYRGRMHETLRNGRDTAEGLDDATISYRLDVMGWSPEAAVTRPAVGRPRYITANGCTRTLSEWARHTGLYLTTIRHRLAVGWDPADAVNTTLPKRTGRPRKGTT